MVPGSFAALRMRAETSNGEDKQRQQREQTTAAEEADPCGMTTKRQGTDNGNGRSRSLRDDNKKDKEQTTATEEADPCGMTTKKTRNRQRQRKKQIPAG